MRKLSTIHLKDAEVLNETQLKQICGGSGASPATCEASCESVTVTLADGTTVTQSVIAGVSCDGRCTAADNVGVTCDTVSDGQKGMTCTQAQDKMKEKLLGTSGGSGSFA